MYDVYFKNNHQKKLIFIVIGAVAAIILASILFVLLTSKNPEKTLKEYYTKIESGKYEELYDMLDDSSKSKYSQEEFIKRNQNIYDGMDVSHIQVEITDQQDDEISYHVTMDTQAGEANFENKTTIKDNKIVWDDSFIYPSLKEDYKVRITDQKAKRGQILDRNGIVLAGEGEAYSVGLVPGKLNGKNDYEKLASLLGLSQESIEKTMSASWIKDDSFVPLKTISKSNQTLENDLLKIPGVKLSTTVIRSYPYGKATSHVLGYMQKVNAEDLKKHKGEGYDENSYIGRSGIEAAYEKDLKGKDGVRIYVVDENNKEVSVIANQDKVDGKDISLTIDIQLQKDLYDTYQKDKSASVAMNYKTGEILALVSTPTFDSNSFILGMSGNEWEQLNNDMNKPLLNRFKSTVVPGSSMKPITALIGLESQKLDKNKDMNAQMKWQKDSSWGNYYVTTLHAPQPNNLKNALIYSDNVYFAKAALEIGAKDLEKGYKSLKIGDEIPFELSLDKSQYTSKDFKDDIQVADSGYGQGQILMNPVQLAAIYSGFANDGNIMTPYIVKGTESKIWIENAMSPSTASEILNDLKGVIEDSHGTGHSIYNQSYQLAGKTGTGEIKASQDDTTGSEVGWFSVLNDSDSNPVLLTTMVEDVKDRGGSGYVVSHTKGPLYRYLKK